MDAVEVAPPLLYEGTPEAAVLINVPVTLDRMMPAPDLWNLPVITATNLSWIHLKEKCFALAHRFQGFSPGLP